MIATYRPPLPPFADIPRDYRLPVLRALIGIESMRADLYEANEAGDAFASIRAMEGRERTTQLVELQTLILQCRAQVAVGPQPPSLS